MDKTFTKNSVWSHLGPLVGPLLAFCMLLIILFRTNDTPLGLPLVAFFGVIMCHLWKWRGVAIASALLVCIFAYYLTQQASQLWPWTIVLSLSAASTFVVTVLCSEESRQSWDLLVKDAEDYLKTISHLTDKVHTNQMKMAFEQKEMAETVESLKRELLGSVEKQNANERLIKLAKDELTANYDHQQKVMQELFQARQQNATLASTLIDLQENGLSTPQATPATRDRALIEDFQRQVQTYQHEAQQAKNQLVEAQAQGRAAAQRIDALAAELNAVQYQHHEKVAKYQMQLAAESETKTALQRDVADLRLKFGAVQQENELAQQEFMKVQQTLAKAEQNYATACSHEAQQTMKLQEAVQKYQQLVSENLANKALADQLQAEKNALAQQLQMIADEQKNLPEPTPECAPAATVDHREARRLEGLYQQLRKQFSEKSEVVAATRRELFNTQEQLMALQKDIEESKIYEENEVNATVYRLLAQAEREISASEKEHAIEVERLHEVIDSLIVSKG